MVRAEEYLREDGSSPYRVWFDSLEAEAAAKVATAVLRTHRGLTSSIKWLEGIGEYKIDWGPGLRIYLAQDGAELIILPGGGTKKQQNADINQAKSLHQEYKDRKKREQKLKDETHRKRKR